VVKVGGARGWPPVAQQGAQDWNGRGHDGDGALGSGKDDKRNRFIDKIRVRDCSQLGEFEY